MECIWSTSSSSALSFQIGGMRAEVLVVWLALTLSCALVWAREDAKKDKLSGGSTQVREAQGPVERRRQGEDVEMSDEPAEVVEEKTKPKKKKTPEEIEAGEWELLQTCLDTSYLDLFWPLGLL